METSAPVCWKPNEIADRVARAKRDALAGKHGRLSERDRVAAQKWLADYEAAKARSA
jgi:hypothetical protein